MTTANRETVKTVEAVQHVETLQTLLEKLPPRTGHEKARGEIIAALDYAIRAIRAPAASVGDAPSDAVAWIGPHGELVSDSVFQSRVNGLHDFGDLSVYRALYYTAPPAAPVVSELVEGALTAAQLAQWLDAKYARHREDEDLQAANMLRGAISLTSSWLEATTLLGETDPFAVAGRDCSSDLKRVLRLSPDIPGSVPATDDKAPAVDAEPVAWAVRDHSDGSLWGFTTKAEEAGKNAEHCDDTAVPLYAAPTSPHDVDAEVPCSTHPDAPHGFDRNGSHNADRYVCECEGWMPPSVTEKVIQDVCDLDPYDPDKEDALCVSVADLELIVSRHTSGPHDVDAVRVDEAMVERATKARDALGAWKGGMPKNWYGNPVIDNAFASLDELTAALRKPGDSA